MKRGKRHDHLDSQQFGVRNDAIINLDNIWDLSQERPVLVGSMRQETEELSITIVPLAANFGAQSNEVPPPAENIATSAPQIWASCIPIMVYGFPLIE